MTISGTVSFERPSVNTATDGLDYGNLQTLPVREAVLEAVDGAGMVVVTSRTDANGNYSVVVPAGQDVRIRVLSRTVDGDGDTADWDVAIADNTNNNAVYAIQGALADSGGADSTRDLVADVGGFNGSTYTSTRASGPFAILDSAYKAVRTVVDVDPDAVLPPVQLRWSIDNRGVSGDVAQGEIGTSSYQTRTVGGVRDAAVYILGDEGVDTDEFDESVVVHEWGHYFEDQMSRSDSIGGSHSLNSLLDPRVALGEGFGNALSAIVLDGDRYRDSFGAAQSQGFNFSLESQPSENPGWFKEFSVQAILYDIADADADANDTLSEGFGPIYRAMTDPDYIALEAFTTIYSMAEFIKTNTPSIATGVDELLARENITGDGILGTGETNEGTIAESLPVYIEVPLDGTAVEFCSVDNAGTYNRLGNRKFLRFTNDANRSLRFDMRLAPGGGGSGSDPDFLILQDRFILGSGRSGEADAEVQDITLDAGTYTVDAYAAVNVGDNDSAPPGTYCYQFSIAP